MAHTRTVDYIKQVKYSVIYKILSILTSFALVPIMVHYLGEELYGVWSTLLSIVSWIILFDIGIGNGLKNKLSESLAKKNIADAQGYISTSYCIIGVVSISLVIGLLSVSSFINWQTVFNIKALSNRELMGIINVTFVMLFLNFWLNLINQVLNGVQKTSMVVFGRFLFNVIALASIYLLSRFSDTSFFSFAFLYGLSLVASNIFMSVWFYQRNRHLVPKLSLYAKKYVKSIASLGMKFFIIQIAVLIIFTTDKILITQLFGPKYVTPYDVVFKLFSIITVIHGLLIMPLWAAYSDAYHKNDFEWIRKSIKNQLKIFIGFIVGISMLVTIAPTVLELWIGKGFEVDYNLIVTMGVFMLVSTWNNIWAYVLNGIGKIRCGTVYATVLALFNIPLSYYFAILLGYGVVGIVLGTISALLLSALISPIQVYYFIYTGAKNFVLTKILS